MNDVHFRFFFICAPGRGASRLLSLKTHGAWQCRRLTKKEKKYKETMIYTYIYIYICCMPRGCGRGGMLRATAADSVAAVRAVCSLLRLYLVGAGRVTLGEGTLCSQFQEPAPPAMHVFAIRS